MRGLTAAPLALALAWAAPLPAPAQGFTLGEPVGGAPVAQGILVIDFERVFSESAFGRRAATLIEQASARLAAENRRIEADLTAEERSLTEQRDTLATDDFRTLARDFDERVQRLRREQDAKGRALAAQGEEARRTFLAEAQPVIEALMQEAGAQVILERRVVFAATDAIDVTDRAIARIDAEVGAGDLTITLDAADPTGTDRPGEPAPPAVPAD